MRRSSALRLLVRRTLVGRAGADDERVDMSTSYVESEGVRTALAAGQKPLDEREHTIYHKDATFELPPNTTEYAVTVTASLARYFLMRNRSVGMSSRGLSREFLQADRGER